MITDDIRLVHEMVRAGLGLGALPTFLANEDLATGRLVRVLPRLSLRSGAVFLVHPPSKHLPRKVLAFRDYLVDRLATHRLLRAMTRARLRARAGIVTSGRRSIAVQRRLRTRMVCPTRMATR